MRGSTVLSLPPQLVIPGAIDGIPSTRNDVQRYAYVCMMNIRISS
jgi:hypothetical protein